MEKGYIKENNIITGEIQAIKRDRKAIQINSIWYNSFKPLMESFNKGDTVKLLFNKKGTFNNISSIEKFKFYEPVPAIEQLNEIRLDIMDSLDIPNQTQNTIIMCTKDIIVASINEGKGYTEIEMTNVIKKLTKDFIEAYKLLEN